jgi:hypothetical protein
LEPESNNSVYFKRFLRNSATALLVHHLAFRVKVAHSASNEVKDTGYFSRNSAQLRATVLILRDLLHLIENRKATLLVIPTLEDIAVAHDRNQLGSSEFRHVLDELRNQGWIIVDLLPRVMKLSRKEQQDLYLSCDGHWSPPGNAFARDALLEIIK